MVRQKLIDLRKAKRYTGKELADKIGITRQYLSAIEHGKVRPGLETIMNIATALETSVANIIKIFEEENKKTK